MPQMQSIGEKMDPGTVFALRLGLTILLAAGAVFGTRMLRSLMGAVQRRLQPLCPSWLHILVQGFSEPVVLLVRAVLLYCAVLAFPWPPLQTQLAHFLLTPLVRAAAVLLIAWGFWRSAPLCRLLLRSAENRLDLSTNQTMGRFFENIYRVLVALFAFLIVLDSFGVPVASLVAGAGIAGLAVSLAAQSTLSNLIAGITLVLEHPFGIGDYIILGPYEGTVEDITFRSTRLRTPDKVAVSIENSKVCAEYIQNGSDRDSRLFLTTLRLPYETPRAALEAFCQDLRVRLGADAQLVPGRVTVVVDSIGEDGIRLMIRVYTATANYDEYLAIRDRINRELLLLLEHHGCSLAYPPADVYLQKR